MQDERSIEQGAGGQTMKKKRFIWILIIVGLLIVAGSAYFFMNLNRGDEIGSEFVEEGILVQKVSERELGDSILMTGKVVPEDEQKIFLEQEFGEIVEYVVSENEVVSAGDPLFHYDTSKIDAEYNKSVRERDLTKKRLNIEQSQIAELDKQIADMKKKVKAGEEFTQEDINELEKQKVQLEMEHEGTKAEVASVQETINELAATKKSMTATSKMDGVVVKVNKNIEPTEMGSNEPVIHIVSSEPYKVIGTMSEFDTVNIQPDQQVIIRPKVYKDREWNGVVESVSSFPDGEEGGDDFGFGGGGGNVTMYPFKVAITDDTSELRQGFHVSLEVKLSGNEKMLAIPHMALMVDEEGAEYVYVLQENQLTKRMVATGEMNDEYVGIVEGLAADELVVINPNEGMHDEMEVISFDEVE